jgi:hypothetical protein
MIVFFVCAGAMKGVVLFSLVNKRYGQRGYLLEIEEKRGGHHENA